MLQTARAGIREFVRCCELITLGCVWISSERSDFAGIWHGTVQLFWMEEYSQHLTFHEIQDFFDSKDFHDDLGTLSDSGPSRQGRASEIWGHVPNSIMWPISLKNRSALGLNFR